MHRIDSSTAEADTFGAGKDGFTEGTPGSVAATETTDDWFNGVQEEIISPIEDMGITLVKGTRNQLWAAIKKMCVANAAGNHTTRDPAVAKAINLYAVCSGDDDDCAAVAVGAADGANAYALCIGDGRRMTRVDEHNGGAKNLAVYGVAGDGSGTYVAVGEADGADAYIIRGTGHAAWVEVANPLNLDLNGVCYGSLWVAVGEDDGADSYIATSSDGLAPWTQRGAGALKAIDLNAVAWNGSNLYCAVGDFEGGSDTYVLTSPDGITWTERSNGGTSSWLCVAYGGGYWVAASGTEIFRSADGTTWVDVTPSGFTDARSVAYGEGVFVTVGSAGEYWISIDQGENWIGGYLNIETGLTATGVAFSSVARCFVVVGDSNGAQALVATSHHVVV